MDDYRLGSRTRTRTSQDAPRASEDSLPRSSTSSRLSSRHPPHPPVASSSRRASLPLFVPTTTTTTHSHPHPYLPSPRSSTYRHRPSISSVTTNGTSTSTSTSTNDDSLFIHPRNDATLELAGIYRDMQSYVFGTGPQAAAPSQASTSLHPNPLGAGPSSRRNIVEKASRNSSSTTSMAAASIAGSGSGFLGEYQDSDMNDNSDVGSAYSPEDDPVILGPQRRWERSATANDHARMDIDLDRKLSRDLTGLPNGGSGRTSTRSKERKRERNRYLRSTTSTSTLAHVHQTSETDELTTDEDDSKRISERAKMRAIDDGGRRPSLPINVQHAIDPFASPAANQTLAPLSLISPASVFRSTDDPRPSVSSAPGSPSTPTAAKFAVLAGMIPLSNTDNGPFSPPAISTSNIAPRTSSEATSPHVRSPASPFSPSSSTGGHASSPGHEIKTRPRSRSNRAAKPLPSLPSNAGINPGWIPPWTLGASNASIPMPSSPPGLPPAGTNPFLQSNNAPARNPFTTRDRSTTITQQQFPAALNAVPLAGPPDAATGATSPSSPTPPSKAPGLQIVNTSPSPPPEDGAAATADFDIDFIMTGVIPAKGLAPEAGTFAARKASLAPSVEDSFARFVNKFDDEYGERRDQWSYRIERPSASTDWAQGDYWKCENMGNYWVGREATIDDGPNGGLDGFTSENSILVRFCPPPGKEKGELTFVSPPGSADGHSRNPPPESAAHLRSHSWDSSVVEDTTPATSSTALIGKGGGVHGNGPISPNLTPSQKRTNVRAQIKKHPRAPAFTLYLGPRTPRSLSASRPSILLAPKAYHLHTSSSPSKARSASGGPSRTRSATLNSTPSFDSLELDRVPTTAPCTLKSQYLVAGAPSPNTMIGLARPSAFSRRVTSPMPSSGDYEMVPLEHTSSSGHSRFSPPLPSLLPPSPPSVSLDLMSVAAATGRMTSAHNQAFETLSPDEGQAVLENLKHRSSIGVRLKRAFGGMNSGSKENTTSQGSAHSHSSVHSEHTDGGKDGRSTSPHVVAGGKHHKDHHHGREDHAAGSHEAAFEPPWMLMTPMYVKEAVIAAERSMYTGFASLGLAVPSSKKIKKAQPPSPTYAMSASMRRNSVLESVPAEAMCMVLPLWDLTLDVEEDRRRRRPIVDDLDIDLDDLEEEDENEEEEEAVDEMLVDSRPDVEAIERKKLMKEFARRRKLIPPPKMERKYLLAYYVPFNAKRQSMAATTVSAAHAASSSNEHRTSKKRPRQGTSAASTTAPSLARRNSGSGARPASKPLPVRSFRVVSRILTPAELRDSGLNPPRNIVDPKRMQQQSTTYYSSPLNYQRMDRRLSSSSILGDVVPSAFSAVIAVCHDRRKGVEFIPEGLDSLGLCGGETVVGPNGTVEKLPPLFPPAHMVPVSERRTPPLNAVGKQIVEMIWSGCLALTELGI